MPAIRTVLFDLDGTLIDSVRLILDSYHHTLATHGLPPRSDEEWLAGVGTPLTAQFAAWRDDPETLQALIATYREYNLKHHDRMVTVYPGRGGGGARAQGRRGRDRSGDEQEPRGGASRTHAGAARGHDGRAGLRGRGGEPQAPSRAGGESRPAPERRPARHGVRGRQRPRHARRPRRGRAHGGGAVGPVRPEPISRGRSRITGWNGRRSC